MDGLRTRGQPAATSAVLAMIRGGAPHAVLLVGPAGTGKTTLALDLAAGLLCTADVASRPCGSCRACRLVASGGHPDVHRLGPEGPGRQVVIGGAGARFRGIRDLIGELALAPAEGGARVAIIASAQRMHEDAQGALLKTLEEPPSGVTIVLCADTEDPILPTIRSRCARLRLGAVPIREVEAILADHEAADPATAARLARLADGRPGIALAWARDPAWLPAHDELRRVLLDGSTAGPAERLAAMREAWPVATIVAGPADGPTTDTTVAPSAGAGATAKGRGRGRGTRSLAAPVAPVAPEATGGTEATAGDRPPAPGDRGDDADPAPATDAADPAMTPEKVPVAERRRAAEAIVAVWTDLTRDVLLVAHAAARDARDPRLLDETRAAADAMPTDALVAFLDRLGRAGVLLAGNASPELVIDDLALAWPVAGRVAA